MNPFETLIKVVNIPIDISFCIFNHPNAQLHWIFRLWIFMNISNIPIDNVFCICNHQSPNRTIALNIPIMNIRECYEYSIDIVFCI